MALLLPSLWTTPTLYLKQNKGKGALDKFSVKVGAVYREAFYSLDGNYQNCRTVGLEDQQNTIREFLGELDKPSSKVGGIC